MFHLVLTTCFAGILCYASEPDVDYISAERCLQQGAILSGLARAQLKFPRMPQTSRIVCSGIDGSTETVYLGQAGAEMPAFPDDALSLPAID
ncbi:hypothetical protein [Dongia deserti]|uniref:hypothetical protein n=1 Tax=Dongia deserti TaxID=2268030 RepID=UPI000E64C220|nr:hypothetical protein [Dongia deserti]